MYQQANGVIQEKLIMKRRILQFRLVQGKLVKILKTNL